MLDVVFKILVLSGAFASVFLIAQLAIESVWRKRAYTVAVNRRLKMIRAGSTREEIVSHLRKNSPGQFEHLPPLIASRLQAFQRMMMASALPFTPLQMLAAMAAGFGALCIVILFFARAAGFPFTLGILQLTLVVAFCASVALPLFLINMQAQRRRKKIQQQFPVSLDVFVRALRSGHPVASAIDLLQHEMEDPIGSEFGLVADEVSYGADLRDALDDMAQRWGLEDMNMFVVSVSVQTETGGNLAEILQNLSEVIRARASMYLKVRALSSEGRMTGWMLTGLPIFAFVSLFLSNPGFYLEVASDSMFIIGFSSLLSLYVVGFIWIRKLVDLKV